MANPIAFKPKPVDPHLELERRLHAAPREHAEALLVVYDILQAAHDNGLLDTAHGLITARDTILGKLAEYAKPPRARRASVTFLPQLKFWGHSIPRFSTGCHDRSSQLRMSTGRSRSRRAFGSSSNARTPKIAAGASPF